MKVAVIQMVSKGNVAKNLSELARLCALAAQDKPDLVLLPENFALFNTEQLYALAKQEAQDNRVIQCLVKLAKKFQFALVAGSFPQLTRIDGPPCEKSKVRSGMLFIDPEGRVIARYDKTHLFDVAVEDAHGQYQESNHIEPGDRWVVVEYKNIKVGLSICYDLRFPDVYRALARQGADVICVAAAFTQITGAAHWKILLQARAIENQCYILGANQGGQHDDKRQTYGHSMIVDPWGKVVEEVKTGPGVVSTQLDLEYLKTLRNRMPISHHEKVNLPVKTFYNHSAHV